MQPLRCLCSRLPFCTITQGTRRALPSLPFPETPSTWLNRVLQDSLLIPFPLAPHQHGLISKPEGQALIHGLRGTMQWHQCSVCCTSSWIFMAAWSREWNGESGTQQCNGSREPCFKVVLPTMNIVFPLQFRLVWNSQSS